METENENVQPIKRYYIAYFDLLGYKNFFKTHPEKAGDFLKTIHEAIQNTKKYIQWTYNSPIVGDFGQVAIQTKVFSDNVLLCLETSSNPLEYLRFLTFISIVADIQRNFILQYNLFLRGGITIGELSLNDNFIFGQGVIDAVALEESAKYPRIIIGQTVLDYILQSHFVKPEDLQKACKIEDLAHTDAYNISDEKLAFCNSIVPDINREKFFLQWRNHLIFQDADGAVILNYLYCMAMNRMIDQRAKNQLEQHKNHIIQKIKEFGTYNDLEISAIKEAEIREQILKKYFWALSFHNSACKAYDFPECSINCSTSLDIRFMRMNVEISDDNL